MKPNYQVVIFNSATPKTTTNAAQLNQIFEVGINGSLIKREYFRYNYA
jgi:hypothetical protein